MSKIEITVTIEDIMISLCELDTEYRESLAKALMDLKYLSDSPLNLSMGTDEQQEELKSVYERPLKSKEVKEIISYISKDMKGDFQYGRYSRIASEYMNMANAIDPKKKGIER